MNDKRRCRMVSAALGFIAGVLACVLVVVIVLPAVIRSQCAKTVRMYHEFQRPHASTPVIVIEREISDTAVPGSSVRRRVSIPSSSPVTFQSSLRVDSPPPPPSAPAASPGEGPLPEEATILQQVYEQNVRLREQFAQQSNATAPENVRRAPRRIDR